MGKPSFQVVPLSLLLIIISVASGFAQSGARLRLRPQSRDTVIFETVGYGDKQIILPIVIVRGGRLVAPPSFNMKAARRRFTASYYRLGQKYRLLQSGGEAATVTVKNLETCDPTAAYVEMQPPKASEGRALATNSDSFQSKPVERRELTEAEQTAIMKLVEPPFRRGGYGEPSYRGVSSGAEAADLDGDGKSELISTFTTGAKSEHTLFIIAEPRGSGFSPALFLFQPARDEYGDNRVRYDFLAGLDLDGDGISEAILSVNDYRREESWYYVIYKKQGGRWRRVYSGGGHRCPEDRVED